MHISWFFIILVGIMAVQLLWLLHKNFAQVKSYTKYRRLSGLVLCLSIPTVLLIKFSGATLYQHQFDSKKNSSSSTSGAPVFKTHQWQRLGILVLSDNKKQNEVLAKKIAHRLSGFTPHIYILNNNEKLTRKNRIDCLLKIHLNEKSPSNWNPLKKKTAHNLIFSFSDLQLTAARYHEISDFSTTTFKSSIQYQGQFLGLFNRKVVQEKMIAKSCEDIEAEFLNHLGEKRKIETKIQTVAETIQPEAPLGLPEEYKQIQSFRTYGLSTGEINFSLYKVQQITKTKLISDLEQSLVANNFIYTGGKSPSPIKDLKKRLQQGAFSMNAFFGNKEDSQVLKVSINNEEAHGSFHFPTEKEKKKNWHIQIQELNGYSSEERIQNVKNLIQNALQEKDHKSLEIAIAARPRFYRHKPKGYQELELVLQKAIEYLLSQGPNDLSYNYIASDIYSKSSKKQQLKYLQKTVELMTGKNNYYGKRIQHQRTIAKIEKELLTKK